MTLGRKRRRAMKTVKKRKNARKYKCAFEENEFCKKLMLHQNFDAISGVDLGFSRGGGGADFQKEIENFDDLFFRSTKLIF